MAVQVSRTGHFKALGEVPSQAVSDMLMEEFQKIEKEEKKTAKKKKQK